MSETTTLNRVINLNIDALLSELDILIEKNDAGEMSGVSLEGPLTASDLAECIRKCL